MSKYKPIKLSRYYVIVKDNEICTDREIEMKNSFTWEAEAQQVCDDLNEWELKLIIIGTGALRVK
jgi:hypothetical protein